MPPSSSLPEKLVPHAHPQRAPLASVTARTGVHGRPCCLRGRSSGGNPTRRSRSEGSFARTAGHASRRNHSIAK
eukprot:5557126-Pleurochrysis_carterae.AAC.1